MPQPVACPRRPPLTLRPQVRALQAQLEKEREALDALLAERDELAAAAEESERRVTLSGQPSEETLAAFRAEVRDSWEPCVGRGVRTV